MIIHLLLTAYWLESKYYNFKLVTVIDHLVW